MVQRYKSLTVLLFGLLLIKVIVLAGDNWTARAAEPETVEVVGALGVIENPSEITFAPVNVPTTAGGKAAIRSTTVVTINQQVFPINYHTLIQTGDEFSSGIFGLVLDKEGNPILDEDGEPSISSSVDYTSFLPRGDKIYLVSHIETTPSVVYMTTAVQDPETGHLTALDTAPVDFSAVNGVLEACAGVTTAWSTHLGSEEWDPDAKPRDPQTGSIDDEDYDVELLKYFGPEAKLTDVTPYDYGWILEISVDDNGQAKGVKHYAMGRFTHELAYVMPDNRTAYMTDDETNGGIFMFVADKSEDMSAGTLYAAKWLQTSAEGAGSGDLVWIKLGQATDAEIKALIDGGTQFFDMFEEAEPADDGSCAAGYASINTTTGHECLKVKPGMEKAAAFLETRRYAAMLGATTEWSANEGITYDAESNTLYVASSGIGDGMLDNYVDEEEGDAFDLGGHNDIRLPEATSCAGIYALELAQGQQAYNDGYSETSKPAETIDSPYVGVNMKTELMGREWTEEEAVSRGYGEIFEYNICDVDGIAEPDNLAFIPGTATLLIAQDSEEHENDYLWAYNTRRKELTRIQSAPQGSEFSTPYFFPDVNGFAYMTSGIQHPFDQEELVEDLGYPEDAAPTGDERGTLGYFGPFPKFEYSEN